MKREANRIEVAEVTERWADFLAGAELLRGFTGAGKQPGRQVEIARIRGDRPFGAPVGCPAGEANIPKKAAWKEGPGPRHRGTAC